MDSLKFNVDGSARGNPGHAGISCVLRDSNGKAVCLFSFSVGLIDSNSAEILAIKKVVELCLFDPSLHCRVISIVSDSKVVVSWINNDDFDSLEHVNSINYIRSHLKSWDGLEVVHASRMYNYFTDNLAKLGSSSNGDFLVNLGDLTKETFKCLTKF
ncbi:hypothetical protein Ddye_013647 [Dipteronia dyeriana]|uniref:RNase H type-1 domain-containing protein n=1 Tax=Dipteronia dyeriana TaxID=168575 RepID=A0AAD9X6H1_9ROSI|nr:hypothetical protein Ddye_013647 [Dipteronia dyeriana]